MIRSSHYCLLTGQYRSLSEMTRRSRRSRPSARDTDKPKLNPAPPHLMPRQPKLKPTGKSEPSDKCGKQVVVSCARCGDKIIGASVARKARWSDVEGGKGICPKCRKEMKTHGSRRHPPVRRHGIRGRPRLIIKCGRCAASIEGKQNARDSGWRLGALIHICPKCRPSPEQPVHAAIPTHHPTIYNKPL